jgi:hypothetical protein
VELAVSQWQFKYIPDVFFLLRLDFRLDEADCAFSDGGMEGPAADLGNVSSRGQRGEIESHTPGST